MRKSSESVGGDTSRKVWPMCSASFLAASKAAGSVKLQAISCGRNWGFGSDLPTEDGAYTLDLSALKSIRSLDLKSHCVELEPGVTQGQLDEALGRSGDSHYFNVTGAGLGASIIGNALERGIGYSGQRHLDLLDLEIVLPPGELREPPDFRRALRKCLISADWVRIPRGFFAKATSALSPQQPSPSTAARKLWEASLCRISRCGSFPALVSAISDLIAEGACYGVPHIFNRERIVTTLSPHLSQAEAAKLRSSAAPWTALIPIRGSKAVFAAQAQDLETAFEAAREHKIVGDLPEP